MILRDYQSNAVDSTEKSFAEFDRLLGVLPTGGGKTIVFSHLAHRRAQRGQRTLILAHRDELIDQAIDKLHKATGIVAEKEKAEFRASLSAPVVVASVQTMLRRLDRWPASHFGLIVCDEAHHSLSASWQQTLSHFQAQILGVTATPDRGDKRNLGQYYQSVAFEVGLFDLIDQHYLSPITVKSVPLKIDLSAVGSVGGDFKADELGHAIEPYLDEIAGAIRDHARFRRILAFLPLIATSQKFVEACRKAGLSAEHVDGESPDRKAKLTRFADWDFDILSNAMLLSEGFDDCGIDCVIVLRPTRSRPLYAQMVGRGTRTNPGKENLLLLDPLWMHQAHSIVRPAHLIAKSDEEADVITALADAQAALPADVADQMPLDLQSLATEAQAKREEALRKKLEAQRGKAARSLSAEEFALEHGSMETAEYQETMAWESSPATEKQLKYLKRAKIDLATVRGKGHASKLLNLFFGQPRLASDGQRRVMRRLGHPNADSATADEARRFFAELRKPKEAMLI